MLLRDSVVLGDSWKNPRRGNYRIFARVCSDRARKEDSMLADEKYACLKMRPLKFKVRLDVAQPCKCGKRVKLRSEVHI